MAILVAASVRETASMVNELFMRELLSQLDDNLIDLLKDASYEDGTDDA